MIFVSFFFFFSIVDVGLKFYLFIIKEIEVLCSEVIIAFEILDFRKRKEIISYWGS